MLKQVNHLNWDDRLASDDKELIAKINDSVNRLNEVRASEINISGPFARSKIAWKLACYQHALLHRIVALMDGAAVAWNNRCILSAFLSARALMETVAIVTVFERNVAVHLADRNLEELDALGQHGLFATRDSEFIKEYPENTAKNVLNYIDMLDRNFKGFRNHYDRLSERCHPNSLGHNFMFATLDRSNGSVQFCDERDPQRNGQLIMTALMPMLLIETLMERLDNSILEVSDLQHHISPVGNPHVS